MGNCAKGPERRDREYIRNMKREKSMRNETMFKGEESLHKTSKLNETEIVRGIFDMNKSKSNVEQSPEPHKSKLVPKIIQKYAKPQTIKEDE